MGVCACLCGLYLCISVCMCWWHIVYVKAQMQCIVLTGYKFISESYFCYIILFLYL